MGRQSAGNGFLRAAVAGRRGRPLWAYSPHQRSAEIFAEFVRGIDPAAETRWLPPWRLDLLGELGTLYLPDPGLADAVRLRSNPAAYSLCGITHSLASHETMDSVIALLREPVMPWDALICTSAAVAGVVNALFDSEAEYLDWRFGGGRKKTMPQTPIIPIGVRCSEFVFSGRDRAAARLALGIRDDETAALYVGRLSLNTKAHPHAMHLGLQGAAERSGKRIVLIQCGWFGTPGMEKIFRDCAARDCPSIRVIFTDGRLPESRRHSWAAADFFISLADNIQETFGMTPIEAMAAGLPALVTDWNGYKETVRDGVDGFRIPTWMPPPDLGDSLAAAYEAGADPYGAYVGLVSQTVSLDIQVVVDRAAELVANPQLRCRLGEAARSRAASVFDWEVVYNQYEALWEELGKIRRSASRSDEHSVLRSAPRGAPGRMDPYRMFRDYPSSVIEPAAIVSLVPGATSDTFAERAKHPLFAWARKTLPAQELANNVVEALSSRPESIAVLSERTGMGFASLALAISVLAKMGIVRLQAPQGLPGSTAPDGSPT